MTKSKKSKNAPEKLKKTTPVVVWEHKVLNEWKGLIRGVPVFRITEGHGGLILSMRDPFATNVWICIRSYSSVKSAKRGGERFIKHIRRTFW